MHKSVYYVELAYLEGSKFWFSVLTELQKRSVNDLSIAGIGGLTGLTDNLKTVNHRRVCKCAFGGEFVVIRLARHMHISGDRSQSHLLRSFGSIHILRYDQTPRYVGTLHPF